MKVIPIQLQEHYDSGYTTLAYGILIERLDGQLFGFTSHDSNFVMDISAWGYAGQTAFEFDSRQGLNASNIVTTAGLQVDNLELNTLNDQSLFTTNDILNKFWDNAKFRIFKYNWSANPVTIANHVETVIRGTFGNITINKETIKIELRGITQLLQQPLGIVSTKTCRARFGSTTGPNKCLFDLSTVTHNVTVTSVGSDDRLVFSIDNATFADDYFGEGEVTFTSGANQGVTFKVRTSVAAGILTLATPTLDPIQTGDTLTAVRGCRKRLEDCVARNNAINFQGEPHRPLTDNLLRPAVPNA